MDFSAPHALTWTCRLIALAISLQTFEFFFQRKVTEEIWSWNLVALDLQILPRPCSLILNQFFQPSRYHLFLGGRILLALLCLIQPHFFTMALLLFSTLCLCLRWRGTYHGGSDFMMIIVLLTMTVAMGAKNFPMLPQASLWYLSLQTCTSYFLAGLIKLRTINWRSGKALAGFLQTTIYPSNSFCLFLVQRPLLTFLASWMIILFECSFPLALLIPSTTPFFLILSLFFHLGNSYFFGLNHFLFSWLAAYPSLIFCAQ